MTPIHITVRHIRGLEAFLIAVWSELTPRASTLLTLLVVLGASFVSACSDAPMAPETTQSIDRIAAARVMPSVTDARTRLAPAIENASVRERVTSDLQSLESALSNGDGPRARLYLRSVGRMLNDYRLQRNAVAAIPDVADAADVSAIDLMLAAVSDVVASRAPTDRSRPTAIPQ